MAPPNATTTSPLRAISGKWAPFRTRVMACQGRAKSEGQGVHGPFPAATKPLFICLTHGDGDDRDQSISLADSHGDLALHLYPDRHGGPLLAGCLQRGEHAQ